MLSSAVWPNEKFEVSLQFLENFRPSVYSFCKAIHCQSCCHDHYDCQVLPKNILQPILQISWICLQKCQVITVQCSCLCVTHVSDMRTFLFFFTWCLTLKNTACYSKVLISLPSKYSKKETNLFFLIFNVNISNIYLRTNSKLSDLVFTS